MDPVPLDLNSPGASIQATYTNITMRANKPDKALQVWQWKNIDFQVFFRVTYEYKIYNKYIQIFFYLGYISRRVHPTEPAQTVSDSGCPRHSGPEIGRTLPGQFESRSRLLDYGHFASKRFAKSALERGHHHEATSVSFELLCCFKF